MGELETVYAAPTISVGLGLDKTDTFMTPWHRATLIANLVRFGVTMQNKGHVNSIHS